MIKTMTDTPQTRNDAPLPVAPAVLTTSHSFSTSEAQLEIWLHSQLCKEANCAFNETATLELQGVVDEQALEAALRETVARHEMLRAKFSHDGRTVLLSDAGAYEYCVIDWSNCSNEEADERHRATICEIGSTPFDLEQGPLLRIRLTRMPRGCSYLTITAHHIVLDGWSVFVFCRDLGQLYDQHRGLPASELPAPDRYSAYAQAMHAYEASEIGQRDASYWRQRFEGEIPVLDLPTDRPRPSIKTFASQRVDYCIAADKVARIRKSAAKLGCSLFNYVLVGFQAYLARVTHQQDFSIGVPTAGQAAMGLQNLIGHCVNTVPFRAKVELEKTVQEYVKESRSGLLDALEHQRYTFGRLVRDVAPARDPSRPPIFSVMMNIDPELDERELGFRGLQGHLHVEPRVYENFEWFISGICRRDGQLELQCQFNSDLFDHQTIEQHLEGLETFLSAMAAEPTSKLFQLPVMSIRQRQQLLVDWNATDSDYARAATVNQEIRDQAERTPDRVAVCFDRQPLTYQQLQVMANQLAHYLVQAGVRRGDRVGICMPRSTEMLASALAIWQTGAAYVPLDPVYPSDRLQMMIEDAGLKQILAMTDIHTKIGQTSAQVINLQAVRQQLATLPQTFVETTSDPADVAYVIYTSGSTGKPKGVQVPHGCVVNFLHSMRREPGFGADDRVLAITTMSFDISVLELYLPLICGGQVVIADQRSVVDGKQLMQLLDRHQVNVLQATPSTWRMLVEAGWSGNKRLKALCGGEAFPRDLVKQLHARCGEVWNMYGPTETTVWSTAYRIEDPDGPLYIGKPIANTQLYVLDAKFQPVPVGAVGELYIGGAGVTHGYLNRPELNEARFVDHPYFNPFQDYLNHRLYQTGDLVRYRPDGNVEYLQRNDKQVKLRGHRIELGEIEYRISQSPAVKQAVVVVREDQPGDPRLVAYYVTQPNMNVTADQLRDQVKQSLPAYMVPQYFVELTTLPQTANGKIDRKLLPAPIAVRETPQLVTPRTESECLLAVLWQEALETSAIGVQDNFFNLGGHSLLVMRVIARVEESVGVRLSPQDFLLGTLEQIAKKLDATLPARTEPQATANESVDQSASSNATSPERSNPFGSKPQWWQKVWRC